MPVKITRLDPTEIAAEFKRLGNSPESLGEYIETLKDLEVGSGFTVRVQEVTNDGKIVEVVPDSGDGEDVDTVRTFKRRMKAAAETLGFTIKWKPKGHRVGEGENARYVTDWLVARAVNTRPVKVETVANGQATPV